jgi:hydroxymethylbilane synthase
MERMAPQQARIIRIGTRGSPLALWQANHVAARLRAAEPGLEAEILTIRTAAEKFPEKDARLIGVGIFTREIDEELLSGRIDLAVHSMKDLPSEIHPDLAIAAVPEREIPLDAFVGSQYAFVGPQGVGGPWLEDLPAGSTIATGSPRRKAQILHRRPDLSIVPIRGNVDTRVRKMREGGFAGTILACAGLRRLGREELISRVVPPDWILPAVGQGALAVSARADRTDVLELASRIEHPPSRIRIAAERAFLKTLRGGCQVPAGALAEVIGGGAVWISGVLAAPDGSRCIRGEAAGNGKDAEKIGRLLAEDLIARGGAAIIDALRGEAGFEGSRP